VKRCDGSGFQSGHVVWKTKFDFGKLGVYVGFAICKWEPRLRAFPSRRALPPNNGVEESAYFEKVALGVWAQNPLVSRVVRRRKTSPILTNRGVGGGIRPSRAGGSRKNMDCENKSKMTPFKLKR